MYGIVCKTKVFIVPQYVPIISLKSARVNILPESSQFRQAGLCISMRFPCFHLIVQVASRVPHTLPHSSSHECGEPLGQNNLLEDLKKSGSIGSGQNIVRTDGLTAPFFPSTSIVCTEFSSYNFIKTLEDIHVPIHKTTRNGGLYNTAFLNCLIYLHTYIQWVPGLPDIL